MGWDPAFIPTEGERGGERERPTFIPNRRRERERGRERKRERDRGRERKREGVMACHSEGQ